MKHIKTFEMLKYKTIKMIDVHDWDELVINTYGKPYMFQQQNGCQPRGTHQITIPSKYANDNNEEMNDEIPYKINGDQMGVKFDVWLNTDPSKYRDIFWQRNFYPDIDTLANDLYEKGLIEASDYTINIWW